jgi:hypothetical protein
MMLGTLLPTIRVKCKYEILISLFTPKFVAYIYQRFNVKPVTFLITVASRRLP